MLSNISLNSRVDLKTVDSSVADLHGPRASKLALGDSKLKQIIPLDRGLNLGVVEPSFTDPRDPYTRKWTLGDPEIEQILPFHLQRTNIFESNDLNKNIVKIGNFVLNQEIKLGSGDEGEVFLALHQPSGYLVACKKTGCSEWNGQAENLAALRRLYGFYDVQTQSKSSFSYLFLPLAIGERIDSAANSSEVSTQTLNDELLRLNTLTEAYLRELSYLEECRVLHGESHSEHFIATLKDNLANVMAIDLSPCVHQSELKSVQGKDGRYPLSFTQALVIKYIYDDYPEGIARRIGKKVEEKMRPFLEKFKKAISDFAGKVRYAEDHEEFYVHHLKEIYERYKPFIEKEIKGLDKILLN